MPKLLFCPACGHGSSWSIRRAHRKCKRCRSEWSSGTAHPVSGFRLERREWLRIIDTFLRDETIQSVHKECKLAYATAQKAVSIMRTVMTGGTYRSCSPVDVKQMRPTSVAPGRTKRSISVAKDQNVAEEPVNKPFSESWSVIRPRCASGLSETPRTVP